MDDRSLFPNEVIPETGCLRGLIEVEQTASVWGSETRITPRLVERLFGDGRLLAFIEPTFTRPNYYVVRIDSGWTLTDGFPTHGDDSEGSPDWRDALDNIWDAIESEFGVECMCSAPSGVKGDLCENCGDEVEAYFPVVGETGGCAWGTVNWPIELWPAAPGEAAGGVSLRAPEK